MKKTKIDNSMIQTLFRCSPELHGMIMQALGSSIYKSQKAISKNEFIVHLLKLGLSKHSETENIWL